MASSATSRVRADRWSLVAWRAIERAAGTLARHPQRCRRVPEQENALGLEMRETFMSPWRLMFRIDGRQVQIVAVVDGRRSLHEWLPLRLVQLAVQEPS